jgi:hypothetical protein
VFTVALLTGTDLPYALAATVRSSAGQVIRPAPVLASAALFMVILHETGRIPVEAHTGTNQFGMNEDARSFEQLLQAPVLVAGIRGAVSAEQPHTIHRCTSCPLCA